MSLIRAFSRRRYLMAWQLLFIVLATSWLWAPHLNPTLSYRTSLISQYENPTQPYSWLFRACDVLGGLLIILAAKAFHKQAGNKVLSWLLLIIGIGFVIDPLVPTTCRSVGNACTEYFSYSFLLHAIETVITAAAIFAVAVYDGWLRKKIVSVGFALFQVAYGILFISQLADQQHFNTASQFVYQTLTIVWLAWLCRDYLLQDKIATRSNEIKWVRKATAVWAFINGLLAILVSLAHIHLLGKIKGLYFVGDTAWLAQYGVVIGVIMLYLSRQLARGDLRARQIFLTITGLETLKYSVISPHPGLMALYLLTFCLLFIFRDDFDRGTIAITRQIKLKDLYFMVAALLLATFLAFLSLDRDSRVTTITGRSFDNFSDYVFGDDFMSRHHIKSALLAHTVSTFVLAGIGSLLWILFMPSRVKHSRDYDISRLEQLLSLYSSSSEDYFKLWPYDKSYFWPADKTGFIAYKQTGPVAFALADPITANMNGLLEEFINWTKARRLKVCFLPIGEPSRLNYKKAGLETLQIGSSALIDMRGFLEETVKDKWWRWQKNRAVKRKYNYKLSRPPHSPELMDQLKEVSDAWLTISGRVERGFALGYYDEAYLQKCAIHYLTDGDGNVQAFTNQLPAVSLSDTVTVDLLRFLPAANNAMPYLLYKTIETVAEENESYRYFDLGFVPFAKAKGPILTIARTLGQGRFSARGLEQFKNKFKPDWRPVYLAYEGDLADLALIALNLEKAMEQNP